MIERLEREGFSKNMLGLCEYCDSKNVWVKHKTTGIFVDEIEWCQDCEKFTFFNTYGLKRDY